MFVKTSEILRPIIGTILFLIFTSGCSDVKKLNQSVEKYTENSPGIISETNVSNHFQSHVTGAKEFWRLHSKSEVERNVGNYEESLRLLEHAYNDVAFGKAEKGIALWETAKTYEAMNDYELAANFYEGAAKTTMNPEQAEEFNAKAAALREKIETN